MIPVVGNALRPAATLADVYGDAKVFVPRASFTDYGWLPSDPAVLDFLTGGQLTVAGDMPVVCHASVATDWIVDVLLGAGFDVAPNRLVYRDRDDCATLLRGLGRRAGSLVLQHAHPPNEIPDDAYWIDRALLTFLNNKGNLERLVPEELCPRRRLVPLDRLCTEPRGFPVVVKAPSEMSSGAGFAVAICHTPEELAAAATRFAACRNVVVEDFIDIERNLCVQYVVSHDGLVSYLGAAEQVVDDDGNYLGNWLERAAAPPSVVAAGSGVVQAAADLGYRGIAGLDIVVARDGAVLVIDLNFRLNGSTVPLLFADALAGAHGDDHVARFRGWRVAAGRSVRGVVETATATGDVVPLSMFDPAMSPYEGALGRVAGMVVGASRAEVEDAERRLRELGLE
ncbi:MAG TPA: ATP-grasp domain-containing protein [Actinomycetota bacterium]|nr:ATP-grasp domain-containing protein [Actinomycetota bacterium]